MGDNLYKNKYRVKSCRHDRWDYSNEGYYFITICTKDRELFFGDVIGEKMVLNEFGQIIQDEWKKSGIIRKEIILDYFVIMPNHLHAIVEINNNATVVETNGCSSVAMNGRVETNGRWSLQYKNNFRMEKNQFHR